MCSRHRLEFAKTRIVRGKLIIEYQAIAHKLADMAADIEAAKWLVYYGAWRVDQGTIDAATASKVKLVASEMAVRVTEQAIRIHWVPRGIMRGIFGRPVPSRDLLVYVIGEGTSEIQRNIISQLSPPQSCLQGHSFQHRKRHCSGDAEPAGPASALDLEMRDEIEQAVPQLRDRRNAKALVIAAPGGAFLRRRQSAREYADWMKLATPSNGSKEICATADLLRPWKAGALAA